MKSRRLLVTRPLAQGRGWVDSLRAAGVDAQLLPLIGILPPEDARPTVDAWRRLDGFALAMFVSANAVHHFFALRPPGRPWPARLRAGSTGPGTTAALVQAGVPSACIVAPHPGESLDTESLWGHLRVWPWQGTRALVVRGESGRDWLADRLQEAGASVEALAAYRRVAPEPEPHERTILAAALDDPAAHCWLFSSSESIARLRELTPGAQWSLSFALATHARIAQAAVEAGFGAVHLVEPRVEAVVDALERLPSTLHLP